MNVRFDTPPHSADETNGLKVNYPPARRPFAKWRFRLVLFLFLFPFLFYLLYLLYHYIVIIEPGFVLLKEIRIKAPLEGKIVELKPQNSYVKQHEVIIRLQNELLRIRYEKLKKKIEFDTKMLKQRLASAKTQMQMYKKIFEYRDAEYKKLAALSKKGVVTQLDLSNAMMQLESAKLAFVNARNSYENAIQARRDLIEDEMRLEELKEQLEMLNIRAPIEGVITQYLAAYGEYVSKDDELALMNYLTPTIEVYLSAKNIKHARVGKEVVVILPDGNSIDAVISGVQKRVVKTPAGLKRFFSHETYSLVLQLKLFEPFPKEMAINHLPVHVRFTLFED